MGGMLFYRYGTNGRFVALDKRFHVYQIVVLEIHRRCFFARYLCKQVGRVQLEAVVHIGVAYVFKAYDGRCHKRFVALDIVEHQILRLLHVERRAFKSADFHVVELDVFGRLDAKARFGLDIDVVKREVLDGHFGDSENHAGLLDFGGGDVADVYVTEARRFFGHWAFGKAFVVKQVERKRLALYVLHHNVVNPYFLNHAAPFARCLEADAAVGAVEHAVRNGDFPYAAAHFAADDHPAVPAQHGAVGDGDVLAGRGPFAAVGVASAFNGNAVVAHADVAVRDVHVAARFGVDTVGVGRFGVDDRHPVDCDVVAKLGVDGPERRVGEFDTADAYVFRFVCLEEGRAEKTALESVFVIIGHFDVWVCLYPHLLVVVKAWQVALFVNGGDVVQRGVPPFFPLAVEHAPSFNGDVFHLVGVNQRAKAVHHHALPPHLHKRQVVVGVVGEFERGARIDVEGDVAF